MTKKIIHTFGKRKTSVARATIADGSGIIRINNVPLEIYGTELVRQKIMNSLNIASDYINLNSINIKVNVKGGGTIGQSDAIANAVSRGLVEWTKNDDLLKKYLTYDRTLIAGDHRLTEVHKPSQSSKGPRHRRQKSYR